jgi:hypothetical protein
MGGVWTLTLSRYAKAASLDQGLLMLLSLKLHTFSALASVFSLCVYSLV